MYIILCVVFRSVQVDILALCVAAGCQYDASASITNYELHLHYFYRNHQHHHHQDALLHVGGGHRQPVCNFNLCVHTKVSH